MKRLILLVLLLASSATAADYYISIQVTATNLPVTGNSATIDAHTRIFTNTTAALTVATNLTIASSLTNYYAALQNFQESSPSVIVRWVNSTNITIEGTNLTFSIGGAWAYVSATNVNAIGTNRISVVTPIDLLSPPARTNAMSEVGYGVGKYSTQSAPTGSVFLKHYGDLTTPQTVSNKTQVSATNVSGLATNMELRGVLIIEHPGDTNGSGISFGQHHLIANSAGSAQLVQANGQPAEPNLDADIITYYWLFQIMPRIGIGTNQWLSYNSWSGSNNFTGGILVSNGTLYGLRGYGGYLSNVFAHGLQVTNLTMAAGSTNINAGDISFQQYDVAIGNGVNLAVLVGTNEYVNAYGLTGAYEIDGFQNWRGGKEFTLLKTNSFTLTIGNDTGDPTLANRILTGTGASITTTQNPAAIRFRYIGPLQKWLIVSRPAN